MKKISSSNYQECTTDMLIVLPLIKQPKRVKYAYQEYLDNLSERSLDELLFSEWAEVQLSTVTPISDYIITGRPRYHK